MHYTGPGCTSPFLFQMLKCDGEMGNISKRIHYSYRTFVIIPFMYFIGTRIIIYESCCIFSILVIVF